MRYRSSLNSVGDSETGLPAFHTSCVSASSSMSANVMRAPLASPLARSSTRRSTAWMRAITSARLKGLVT